MFDRRRLASSSGSLPARREGEGGEGASQGQGVLARAAQRPLPFLQRAGLLDAELRQARARGRLALRLRRGALGLRDLPRAQDGERRKASHGSLSKATVTILDHCSFAQRSNRPSEKLV